jgi:predicted MFS family arabinose efflux permease
MDNLRGPFFPEIIQDLKLNPTAASGFYAVAALSGFIGSFTSHRLLKNRDVLIVLTVMSLIFSVGFAGVSQSRHYSTLIFFCIVFGFAYGFLNVLQASSPAKRRRLLNGLQSMYGIAAFLAPMAASLMRGLGFSWRTAFMTFAVLALIVPVVSWWKRGIHLHAHDVPPAQKLRGREWGMVAYMTVILCVYMWGELSASTRLVLWLRTEKGLDPQSADLQLGLFFLGMLTGRLTFSFLSFENFNNRTILMLSALVSSSMYFAGLHSWPWLISLSGLAFAPFFPVMMDECSTIFKRKSSQALGVIIGFGNMSIMAMHLTVGVLTGAFGLTEALHCGPAAMLIVFVLLWGLKYYRQDASLT